MKACPDNQDCLHYAWGGCRDACERPSSGVLAWRLLILFVVLVAIATVTELLQ